MVLFGIVAGVVCGLIAFGWWTIGFSRRRLVGGAAMLLTAFLFSPLALVHSGERYGFDGVVVGLIAISLVVGGGFFFTALGWTGRVRKVRKVRTLSEDPDLF